MGQQASIALRSVLNLADRGTTAPGELSEVPLVGVRWYGKGAYIASRSSGKELKASRLTRLRTGDFIYNRMWVTRGTFAVVPPSLDGCYVTNEYPIFEPADGVNLDFLHLLSQTQAFHAEVDAAAVGSTERRRLHPKGFGDIEVSLPSLEQQNRIVAAVSGVDELLTAAERQARAAWSVLDAVRERAWEEIAVGGESVSIGEITRITSGGTPSRSRPEYFGGDIPWVKTGEVAFCEILETEEHISEAAIKESAAKLLPKDSVLVAMYGQGATRGRSAILGREMATNQACAAILPNDRIRPRYLFHWLWSHYEELRAESEGSSQPNLNQTVVSNLELPVVPVAQQDALVREFDPVLKLAESLDDEVEVLGSLRASTVEALVTGMRDVPDLPEVAPGKRIAPRLR